MKIKQKCISIFLFLAIMFSLSTNIFAISMLDTSNNSLRFNIEDILLSLAHGLFYKDTQTAIPSISHSSHI